MIILTRSYQKTMCFREVFSVVNSLLPMIEKVRELFVQGGACNAFSTDLSNAFDCFHHKLAFSKTISMECHQKVEGAKFICMDFIV